MTTTKLMVAALGSMAFAIPALADDSTTDPAPATPTAQQQCKQERTDMGKAVFAQTYGTNKNRSNAFGKCVSKRSTATDAAKTEAHTNAAKTCKAERSQDAAAFKAKYATNRNKRNAFGKCVSKTAKAEQQSDEADAQTTQS